MSLHFNSIAKSTTATTSAAAVQAATKIEVDVTVYALIAMALGCAGIMLARMVTIEAENKRLGKAQPWRETFPLTGIAILIVCPLIWHFEIAVPGAALIGIGVGYSVRVILRIVGTTSTSMARALAERAIDALGGTPQGDRRPLDTPLPDDMKDILDRMPDD
ncbi:MAG: hypothetical protein ABW128_06725 [Rhizorhabdus sp.]